MKYVQQDPGLVKLGSIISQHKEYEAEKYTGGFPWTEILSNIPGEMFLWCTSSTELRHVGPHGPLTSSSYATATYKSVKKAPSVQG